MMNIDAAMRDALPGDGWKTIILSMIGALAVLASFPAHATNICWVERVERSEDGLRIFVMKGYGRMFFGRSERDNKPLALAGNQDDVFVLRQGDVANYVGLHDGCSIKPEIIDGVLGAQLDASLCLQPMGCNRASGFVRPE